MILESQFKHFLGYSLVLVVAIVALLLSPSSLYAQKKVESEEFIIRYSLKSTEVEEDILDNKANLAKINDYLLRSPRIDSITIYSYASPEGAFGFNSKLAEGRGRSAKQYLLSRIPAERNFNPDKIVIDPTAENWVGLRQLVFRNYWRHDRERLLQIIDDDSVGTETQKWRIQQLNEGYTWKILLRDYMPQLRYSTWICVWVAPDPELESLATIGSKARTDQLPLVYQPLRPKQEIIRSARKTILALKTNLLYDAVTAVNFAVEVPVGKQFSVLYEHHCPWWLSKNNKYCLQFLSYGGEARWWFAPGEDVLTGHYLGAYGWGGILDIQAGRDFGCYQADFTSFGLSYGYSMPIGKHLNMEFSLSAGYARIPYQHYVPTSDWQTLIKDKSDVGTLHYFGPTKAEVSLVIPIRVKTGGRR